MQMDGIYVQSLPYIQLLCRGPKIEILLFRVTLPTIIIWGLLKLIKDIKVYS